MNSACISGGQTFENVDRTYTYSQFLYLCRPCFWLTARSRRAPLDQHRTTRACRGWYEYATNVRRGEIAPWPAISPPNPPISVSVARDAGALAAAAMQSMALTFPFLPAPTLTPSYGRCLATRVPTIPSPSSTRGFAGRDLRHGHQRRWPPQAAGRVFSVQHEGNTCSISPMPSMKETRRRHGCLPVQHLVTSSRRRLHFSCHRLHPCEAGHILASPPGLSSATSPLQGVCALTQ
jgi:hypothetical protein